MEEVRIKRLDQGALLDLEEFKAEMVKFTEGYWAVLDADVIEHFASRLQYGSSDQMYNVVNTAVNDPYSDPKLNYGLVDCRYSTGQLANSEVVVDLLRESKSMLVDLAPNIDCGSKIKWSMREKYKATKAESAETHAALYGRTVSAVARSRRDSEKNKPHAGWAAPKAKSSSFIPENLLYKEFLAVRPVGVLLEELCLLDKLTSVNFVELIQALPDSGYIEVIPDLIKLGASASHLDCLAVPCVLLKHLDGGTDVGARMITKYTGTQKNFYYARESLVMVAINDEMLKFEELYQSVISNPYPEHTREARNAKVKMAAYISGKAVPLSPFCGRSTKLLADTYVTTESPARPTSTPEPKGFDKPVEARGEFSLGSLKVVPRMDKLEANLAILAEAQAAQVAANAAFQATVLQLLESK